MSTPLFTVFSACRNAGSYAARSIRSVLSQDIQQWQLIIICDAPTDNTWQWIDRVCPLDDDRIWRFLRPDRQWKLANFLWTLPCMRGDIIVELDGDDWFRRPDALSIIAAAYAASPRVEATAGSYFGYPAGSEVRPCTQPARGYRMMQNGFADSVPAPRTWRRHLTERSLVEMPDIYNDPLTGHPWRTNADLAMFAPALLWAEHIAGIDDILVDVNYETVDHDFALPDSQQRDEGLRLYEALLLREWQVNEPLLRPFKRFQAIDA